MRTELRNYLRDNPRPWWRRIVGNAYQHTHLYFFERKLRSLSVGSTEWHSLQEKLSHKSSVGLDQLKRNLFLMRTLPGCGKNLFVHPLVTFYYPRNVLIGDDVFVNRGVIFMAPAKIVIGSNVLIGPYTMFNSGNHRYSSRSRLIDDQGHIYGEIIVGDDVWIGGHVSILPGVTIGSGAVVAAGAVVIKSVEPFTVVGGVPAKVIGVRDGE